MKKYICKKCGYKLKLFVIATVTPSHCNQDMELKEPFKPGLSATQTSKHKRLEVV